MKDFFKGFDGGKVFWIAVIATFLLGMPIISFILLAIRYCQKKKG